MNPKSQSSKDRQFEYWAVMFTPKIIQTTVMIDNDKMWSPYAIFETWKEAMAYRKEKWMGNPQNKDGDILVRRIKVIL